MKPAGVKFRARVMLIAKALGLKRTEGKISLTIDAYPPDNRRRDLDNIFKAACDGMQHAGLYDDDCNIKHIDATMHEKGNDGGRVIATIQSI